LLFQSGEESTRISRRTRKKVKTLKLKRPKVTILDAGIGIRRKRLGWGPHVHKNGTSNRQSQPCDGQGKVNEKNSLTS